MCRRQAKGQAERAARHRTLKGERRARGQNISGGRRQAQGRKKAQGRGRSTKAHGAHGARLPRGDFKVGPARAEARASHLLGTPTNIPGEAPSKNVRRARRAERHDRRALASVARGEARAPRRRARAAAQGEGGRGDGEAPARGPRGLGQGQGRGATRRPRWRGEVRHRRDATSHRRGRRAPRRNWKSSNANR